MFCAHYKDMLVTLLCSKPQICMDNPYTTCIVCILVTNSQTCLKSSWTVKNMCICALWAAMSNHQWDFQGKSTKGGRGSGKTKTTKISKRQLAAAHVCSSTLFGSFSPFFANRKPSSKLFANISSRMDLLWVSMFMNLCLAKGAEFVYRRAWRSVMPGESCPLTFVSMPVARSSRKYAIWMLSSSLAATQFRTHLFTSQSGANWTMQTSQTVTP